MNITNRSPHFINRLIDVPTSDPDDRRRRRLLNILLTGMATLSIATILFVLFWSIFAVVKDANNLWLGLTSAFGMLSGTLLFYLINRNQHLPGWIASTLFLLFLMVLFAFTDSQAELANGRSLFIFVLPVIMASILLSPVSSFLFAIFSSIEIAVLAKASETPLNTFAVIGFFLVAFISWLSSRGLEQALKELREINTNLDKLVEQKTQELANALSRELVLAGRNQAILDSIADGVIVFDANNIAILANPALSQLTDTPIENLTGIKLADFVKTRELSTPSQRMIMGMIEHPEKTETGVRVEWSKKTLSLSIARVRNSEANQNTGVVAVFRDVTREAELEKMKSTFVGVVSHELRTPLNAIIGYTEMLKESIYGSLNEKQTSVAERIIVNTQRLLAMVGDLLDEAQMKAGKLSIKKQVFKTSSLLENMHATMDKITSDKGLSLTDEFDPNMPETITGDPQRLQQILVNLINNSAKFTEKGGIHVRILRSDTNHWKLEVSDTGSGIPEKEIPYIFETFRQVENSTTRQHGGFGLGLSIVKQLVELLNGKIAVKSDLNIGSTFTITLPFIIEKDI